MKESIRMIVDGRERNEALIKGLEDRGVEIERKPVPVGDYIISDRICIERKTVSDFESSLMSGRLIDQLKRLRKSYELPIIIIEGSRDDFRLGRNVITGALVAIYVDYGMEAILSDSAEETADILASIARHEQLENDREPAIKGGMKARTTAHFQEYIIGNLPGIGTKLARSLLRHFGSINRISNASIDELMEVEKIGKKKAQQIHNVINSEYDGLIE